MNAQIDFLNRICAATPRQSLEDQILNENEPKNEREWWACRHIKYLRDEVIAERNVDIEQLRQRVAELEERRCEVCGYAEHHREHTGCLRTQLAAAQEENGRLENQVLARDAELWGRTQEILGLKEQLTKAEQRVAEWQPISTAPKDGTLFLGWVGGERWSSIDGGGSGSAHDVSQVDFCWWRADFNCPGEGYFDNSSGQIGDSQGVTHWMPLPKAPNGASS